MGSLYAILKRLGLTAGSSRVGRERRFLQTANRQSNSRQPRLERLEERTLLSVGGDGNESAHHSQSLAPSYAAYAEVAMGKSNDSVLAKELATPAWIDRGEYYWADGRKIPLWRSTDEIVVSLRDEATRDSSASELTTLHEPLAGFQTSAVIDESTLVVKPVSTPITDLDSTLADLADRSNVAWTAPVFINSESGMRQRLTDEIVVALLPGVDAEAYFASDEFSGYRPLRGTSDQFVATVAGGGLATLELANALQSDPRLAWASANFYPEVVKNTGDPLYNDQWHLNNSGQTLGMPDADVDAPEAWQKTTGSSEIVIAILDDGVQTDHPDLDMWENPGEIPGNGIDDDNNGYADDVFGWNFLNDTKYVDPSHREDNHGTNVAGVAAAVADNGVGGAGVAHGTKIMAVKLSEGNDYVSDDELAEAIRYAAGSTADGQGTWRGADVLNFSWGWDPSTAVTDAFNWAHDNGRGGLGMPIFVSSSNDASGYETSTLGGLPAGNYVAEWRYNKDVNLSRGEDSAWLGMVMFPDGTVESFQTPSLPPGWSSSGDAPWSIVTDPEHGLRLPCGLQSIRIWAGLCGSE